MSSAPSPYQGDQIAFVHEELMRSVARLYLAGFDDSVIEAMKFERRDHAVTALADCLNEAVSIAIEDWRDAMVQEVLF